MGFFTQEFLAEKRVELMNTIKKFEYEINGGEMWLTAVERSRQVVNNYIRFTLLFPNVLQTDYSITAIRVIDVNNEVIARRDLSANVNSIQNVLFLLSISYQEV